MVPQQPDLFHRSIRDNITLGADISEERLIDVAKKSRSLEFINILPEQFDTMVGERGVKLSGGERQRIAIARAFLEDAPIVVLDEATSALDSLTEKQIQVAIFELIKNKTTHCYRSSAFYYFKHGSHCRSGKRPHHRARHASAIARQTRQILRNVAASKR